MRRLLGTCLCLLSFQSVFAALSEEQLSVWANEAIVATYTYKAENYIPRQKSIAQYFTPDAWISYSNALTTSGLPDSVQKNNYDVSAVALMPPVIKNTGEDKWQASMPVLVVYKNPQYQQKQTLQVTINFSTAPTGQGVRGLTISGLQSVVSDPPCVCQPANTTNGNPSPASASPTTKTTGQ